MVLFLFPTLCFLNKIFACILLIRVIGPLGFGNTQRSKNALNTFKSPRKVTKVFPTRWCPRGPLRKSFSRQNFVLNTTLFIFYDKNNHFQAKNYPNNFTVSKWRTNERFLFLHHLDIGENLKNHFPKRMFQ